MTAKTKTPKNTVNFRGKEVTLKYPLLALQRLEDVGVDITKLGEDGDISITVLGKMVWAGLSVEHRDATLEEVLEGFDISDLQELSEAVGAAFNSMGK